MATIWGWAPPLLLRRHQLCLGSFTRILPFSSLPTQIPPICVALGATGAEGGRVGSPGAPDPALLRRPLISTPEDGEMPVASDEGRSPREGQRRSRRRKEEEWVDWEDQILEDTVPLVGFVRMILHSGKYESGDRLSPEHEKTIMERLLPYHPEFEKKIGCGIDFISIGYHPEFENSQCLFIVRKDGESVDFSYWKCIEGLIRKNYPLYADCFILRHFQRRRNAE